MGYSGDDPTSTSDDIPSQTADPTLNETPISVPTTAATPPKALQ